MNTSFLPKRRRPQIFPALLALSAISLIAWLLFSHSPPAETAGAPPAPRPTAAAASATGTANEALPSPAAAKASAQSPAGSGNQALPKLFSLARNADGGYEMSIRPHAQLAALREVRLAPGARPAIRSVAEGTEWSLELPDRGEVRAKVNYSREDEGRPALWTLGGEVGSNEGSIYLAEDADAGLVSGCLIFWRRPTAWLLSESPAGMTLAEVPVSEIVCAGPDGVPPPAAPGDGNAGTGPKNTVPAGGGIPSCASRPTGASGVLYLDFAGGSLTNAFWNCGRTITYAASGMNSTQMVSVWKQVSEDFKPFNINVTTRQADYTGATIGRRMRVVCTPTNWDSITSGFAAVGSFPGAGGFWSQRSTILTNIGFDSNAPFFGRGFSIPPSCTTTAIAFPSDIMCWMFDGQINFGAGGTLAQTQVFSRNISHEFGHTFGMHHAGVSTAQVGNYYPGHGSGNDSWDALMGSNDAALCQWSKGEYTNSTDYFGTRWDSLAIIAGTLTGGGFIDDDGKGDSIAAAALLNISGSSVSDGGVIFSETDVDFFRIPIGGSGQVQIVVVPTASDGNLDAYAELQNASGTILAFSNDLGSRSATINSAGSLAPGNYYLMVRGSKQGTESGSGSTLTTTGWTRYGNLGEYAITGTINGAGAPSITTANPPPDGAVGVPYNFPVSATNSPTSWAMVGGSLPPGVGFSNGLFSGTPTVAGFFDVTISASNILGTSPSRQFNFTIFSAANLPDSVDAPGLTWTTSGNANWFGQQLESFFGADAGRSGNIGANSESVLETLVTGPGLLTFYWRTSSDPGDRLIFTRDTTELYNIGGEIPWEQRSVSIPNGSHFVRWTYRTDPGTTAGQNAGFVDKVVYSPVAQFPNGNVFLAGTVGQNFSWEMSVTGSPTGFSVASGPLPPGLNLDPVSGKVSGTPTTVGTYPVEIAVTNAGGTTSTFPTFYIYPGLSLATAVDNTSLTYVTGGDNPWVGDFTPNHDGADAAHSGPIKANQFSFLQTTVTGPGTVKFWWKSSTDAAGDFLRLTLDGAVVASVSGEVDWTERVVNVGSGSHLLRWEFSRDSNGNGGSNMVWVDQLTFTPASSTKPLITSNLNVNAVAGQQFTYQIVATNSPTSYSAQLLPPGLNVDGATGIISGVPRTAGFSAIVLTAVNASGFDLQQLNLTVTDHPMAVGPDFSLNWSSNASGGNVWFNQSAETHDGIDAMRSGPITHNQVSTLQAIVYGPGNIYFWWRVDSEADFDILEFIIDGVVQTTRSGNQPWTDRSVSIASAGSHVLEWKYRKDNSGSVGLDSAFVDQVVWTPAAQLPVITSTSSATAVAGSSFFFFLAANNNPTSYSISTGFPPGGINFNFTSGSFAGTPTRTGAYPMQLIAFNGAGTSAASPFTINVQPSFNAWATSNGLSGGNALPTADPDRDSRTNLLEMALNLSPNIPEQGFRPVWTDPVTKRLTATFTRVTAYPDLQYEVQVADNPNAWTTIARSIDGGVTQNVGGAFSVTESGGPTPIVTVVDNAAPPTKPKRSMRIKITQL